jgi:CubicO group peptidase (beta-lactamase class C family)
MPGSRKLFIAALSCVCLMIGLAGNGWTEEVVKAGPGKKLDEYLTRIVPFGFSGAVLAARDGEVVLNKGYGLAIRSGGVANTSETVFGAGSITKQFTAAAIMKLEAEGKLNSEDRLSEHLGGVPQNKVDITLHHLLTHTAGVLFSSGDAYTIAQRDGTVKKILDSPAVSAPGERFEYSNAGYTLLAAVVEEVSGKPYEQFLREDVFLPAGMKFTGYRLPEWDKRTVAHWYAGDVDNGTPLERDYPYWNLIGNGGMLSTTGDLYRWTRALMDEKALSGDYTYGWDVLETAHGRLIEHGGGSALGNAAEIRNYIDAGVVTVAFCNADGEKVLFGGVRDRIEKAVFGGDVDLPPAPVALDPGELKKFAAVYDLKFGGTFTITVEGDALRIKADGHGAMNVLAFPEYEDLALLNNDLDERSYLLFDAASRGDYSLVKAEVGDDEKAGRLRDFIEGRLAAKKAGAGDFRQVKVEGTVPASTPGEMVTFVTLRGDNGAEVMFRVHWNGGELAGLDEGTTFEPVSMRLLPLSPTQFAGYHLGWCKGLTVDFEVDSHNSVRTLTIPTAGEDIVATRR